MNLFNEKYPPQGMQENGNAILLDSLRRVFFVFIF
jgi:hypothetical protein